MKNSLKIFLLGSMLSMLLFLCDFSVDAVKVKVDYPRLHIKYKYEIPDEVARECLTPRFALNTGVDSMEEVSDLTTCDNVEFVRQNDRPLLTKWLNGLIDNPKEFFKAYFAAKSLFGIDSQELECCIERIKEGKSVRFDFCTLQERINKFQYDCERFKQKDIDSFLVETWSGWHSTRIYREENLGFGPVYNKSIVVDIPPIDEVSTNPGADILSKSEFDAKKSRIYKLYLNKKYNKNIEKIKSIIFKK